MKPDIACSIANTPRSASVGAEPHWARVDDTSGESVNNYGSEFSLAADKELIDNRLYGALNLLYDPEVSRSRITSMWERQTTVGFSAAVAAQAQSGVFFGVEARYMRNYAGIGLDPFAGEALFVGPTMYATLSEHFAISAAWSVQIAGHAVDIPGSLDLRSSEHHQAKLRLEYNF